MKLILEQGGKTFNDGKYRDTIRCTVRKRPGKAYAGELEDEFEFDIVSAKSMQLGGESEGSKETNKASGGRSYLFPRVGRR